MLDFNSSFALLAEAGVAEVKLPVRVGRDVSVLVALAVAEAVSVEVVVADDDELGFALLDDPELEEDGEDPLLLLEDPEEDEEEEEEEEEEEPEPLPDVILCLIADDPSAPKIVFPKNPPIPLPILTPITSPISPAAPLIVWPAAESEPPAIPEMAPPIPFPIAELYVHLINV